MIRCRRCPPPEPAAERTPEVAEALALAKRFPEADLVLLGASGAFLHAEAIAAAQELRYPVVLKVSSTKILHKTEVAGVRVDLRNADEVAQAHSRDEFQRIRQGHRPHPRRR